MGRKIAIILFIFACCLLGGCSKPQENPPAPPPHEVPDQEHSTDTRLHKARELLNLTEKLPYHYEQAKKLILIAVRSESTNDALYVEGGNLFYSNAPGFEGVDQNNWGPNSTVAKELFTEALRINPNNKEAHFALGTYYWLGKEMDAEKASAHWKKYIELDTKNPVPYYRLAQYYLEKEQIEKAEEFARKAVKTAEQMDDLKEVYEGKCVLGNVFVKQGKFDIAEKILKEISTTKDGNTWACAYQGLGVLYHKMGRTKELADSMRVIADGQKDAPLAAFIAALRLFDAGDFALAMKYVSHALTLKNNNRFKILKGYLLILNKDFDAAKKIFIEVLENEPAQPGAIIGLGHLDIVFKDYQNATRRIEPLIDAMEKKLGPNNINNDVFDLAIRLNFKMACLGMGWVMANQNQHAKANKYYDRALLLSPDDILVLLGKGNSLTGLNKLDEAEKVFEKVLKTDPKNQYALAELALVKFKKGETTQAEQIFHKALAKGESQYTCPHEGLGMVYLRQGKITKAKESFQKAIDLNPDIEFKKFNELAKIYIREGKYRKAQKLLRKSTENFPYDNEAKKLLQAIEDR